MIYKENILTYEIYKELRESVEWNNFSKDQAIKAIKNSAYNIVAFDNEIPVAMARVIGDGLYYVIVDVIVAQVCEKYIINKIKVTT